MKKSTVLKTIATSLILIFYFNNLHAQCNYLSVTTTATDTLSYTFSGGMIASFGCAPIDPTYWMSGNGDFVTVTFVSPQSYPTFRVWGMNDDDAASVSVNGVNYPLTVTSASYDTKVVCGLSPGPDGVLFSGGNLVGANSNTSGNYSYQNVQLNTVNVSTITVTGVSGAGWGFAGASINCPLFTGATEIVNDELFMVYPNPGKGDITITGSDLIDYLQITDFTGRIIVSMKPYEKNILLHIENSGIYFLTVQANKINSTSKLIIGH